MAVAVADFKKSILIMAICLLFSCKPEMLDGPGMEYVDGEYRTVYANCLPFDESKGPPYLAIGCLDGIDNIENYLNELFKGLSDEQLSKIGYYEFEGNQTY